MTAANGIRVGFGGMLLAAALSACTVGPDYQKPELTLPDRWQAGTPAPKSAAELAHWWQVFHDPVLNRLVAEALRSNLDLKLAAARIRDVRAQRRATIAAGLPSFGAHSNASRRRNSTAGGAGSATVGGGFGIGGQVIDIFQSGFDASWELDFFGGERRAIEAADAALAAEQENARDVRVTLLAELARNYVDWRVNRESLAVTAQQIQALDDSLGLLRARTQAGLASELEVAGTRAELDAVKAQLPPREAAAQRAANAIAVLLGQAPAALKPLSATGGLPQNLPDVRADLPSELLRRRPDVRRAERELAAATAKVGVAVSELYPKVNLTAFLGLQNTRITDFTPIGKSWSMASSLSVPLFQWGRLNANIASKEALTEQARLGYEAAVLGAFKEVEDAWVSYGQERQRTAALDQSLASYALALRLSKERYLHGLTAYIDVLVAERTRLVAELALVQSRADAATRLIAFYKALGGGWEVEPVAEKSSVPDALKSLAE